MSRRSRRAEKRARARAEKRTASLRNSGPDETGNFGINPYAARGHVVEVAPKELRSNPNSSQFPKRVVTQRMLDRYLAHGHITASEWQAGNALWMFHHEAGRNAKVTGGYDPVMVSSSPDIGGRLASYLDAALEFNRLMMAVPYRSQGVIRAVVIDDQSASDWARSRGYGSRDSERHGLARLRPGLQALARCLGR
jgi:hypothetical protein